MIFSVLSGHANAQLYAGAASVDVTPPIGTPLGGSGSFPRRWKYLFDWGRTHPYANMFTPSIGVLDPIRAKALVLKNHRASLVYISLDVVGITYDFYDVLKAKFKKLGFDDVIISATHTHSGPGALSKSWAWQLIAMDSFNKVVYDQFIAGVVVAVERAYNQMEPASLHAVSFEVEEIHRNRRGHPGHMDNTANLLLAKSIDPKNHGRWIGGIVNYAIHGMAMGGNNLLFSADVSGGIERHLENLLKDPVNPTSKLPTMLFVNGAEGDVTSVFGGKKGVEKSGEIFAQKALEALPKMRPVEPQWKIHSMQVKLPKARLNLGKCGVLVKGKPVNMNIKISKKALPPVATIFQVQFGDILMMSWPGEPTTTNGFESKKIARDHGIKDPWVFGLTNGHMAYFITEEEYDEGGYESCTAIHGKTAALKLLNGHRELMEFK